LYIRDFSSASLELNSRWDCGGHAFSWVLSRYSGSAGGRGSASLVGEYWV